MNDDALILTHGAGSNRDAPLLVQLEERFQAAGLRVLRYDLPFRVKRPHGPPPPGSGAGDRKGLRDTVIAERSRTSGRLFLGGHSYGGRQASMLAAAETGLVDGLLLLSYPLHPPRRPEELRTAHFGELQTTVLFVHGTRDPFGSVEEMRSALALIPARTELLVIDGAGHDLKRTAMAERVVETFRQWMQAG